MKRTSLDPHQQRALAAAAGLVGRPRLRAGLLLTIVAACAPDKVDLDGDPVDSAADASGEASTVASASEGGTSSSGAATTGLTGGMTTGGTLLTEATTLATSGGEGTDGGASTGNGGSTGNGESTGTGESTGSEESTGGLGDCVDPRTGEIDWVCCEAQNWEPAPQCTPWGPPAPPSAAAGRLERARAARGRWV